MRRVWRNLFVLAAGSLMVSRCYISAAGQWCSDPSPACPTGYYCDETSHCVTGTADGGGAVDAGPTAPDAGWSDAGPGSASDAGPGDAGAADSGPFDAGPPVCGFDPTCVETGVPTCAIRCPVEQICDLAGHCRTPRYSVSDAGTVIDQVTGLVWQRDMPANECTDGGFCSWPEAPVYCTDLQLGGFDGGWMVPHMVQLFSLVQGYVGQTPPLLLSPDFTYTAPVVDNAWWSQDLDSSNGTNWVLTLTTGDIGRAPSNTTGGEVVLCVHE